MAVTTLGERLTQAHRLAQGRLSTRVAADLLTLWRLLDPADIDGTFPAFLDASLTLLSARKGDSASIAAQYLRAFREAEGVKGDFAPPLAEPLNVEAASTSLLVTGPVEVKTRVRAGWTLEAAMRSASATAAGAAIRHTLAGGRETIDLAVDRDPAAHGVARVTDGKPCYFCAMLASRGPVYRSEDTARFKPHDACGCQPEPVYATGSSYRWPQADAKGWNALYADSTSGTSGQESINAFRRAYEAQGRTNTGS